MRILHVIGVRNLPSNPDAAGLGGGIRAPLELARTQALRGHEVWVVAAGHEQWEARWCGVKLVNLQLAHGVKLSLRGRRLDFEAHWPLVRFTRQNRFDIIHSHLYYYLRFLRAKVKVIHFHIDPYHNPAGPADFKRIERDSDAQIGVSKFVSHELNRGLRGRGNVHTVYNGVDHERFQGFDLQQARCLLRRQWKISGNATVFLFAGAVVPEKGVIHLARAFVRLSERYPNVHLIIAGSRKLWGDNELQREVRTACEHEVYQALSQAPACQVHMPGKLPAEAMPGVYAASDVIVVPSVWREPFPLVILESFASGKPVIASNAGGMPEIVDSSNGILVPPGDERALEDAMQTLVVYPDHRFSLAQYARKTVEGFTWEAAAEALDRVYAELL